MLVLFPAILSNWCPWAQFMPSRTGFWCLLGPQHRRGARKSSKKRIEVGAVSGVRLEGRWGEYRWMYQQLIVFGFHQRVTLSGVDRLLDYGISQESLSQSRKKDSGGTRELGAACRGTLTRFRMEELGTLVGSGCLDLKDVRAPRCNGPYNRRSGQQPMLRPQASRAESYLNLVGKGAKFELGCLKRTKRRRWAGLKLDGPQGMLVGQELTGAVTRA